MSLLTKSVKRWFCDIEQCIQPALLGPAGSCEDCKLHLCFDHVDNPAHHVCLKGAGLSPKVENEIHYAWWKGQKEALYAGIHIDDLINRASQLRGAPCIGPRVIAHSASGVISGNGSVHVVLTFDDGVKWLARYKQQLFGSPTPDVRRSDLVSEAATLRALYEAGVKVPRVWAGIQLDAGSPTAANYIMLEFIDGDVYEDFLNIDRNPSARDLKVIDSLARYMITLESATFDKIGSLTFDHQDDMIVGPELDYDLYPYTLGPYTSARQRYLDHIHLRMRLIHENAFCAAKDKLISYLALLEVERLLLGDADFADDLDGIEGQDRARFFIKHGEPKGDHFLLDDKDDITAMIDWEWSITTSKAHAFAAPSAFVPEGFDNTLSPHEQALAAACCRLGREDLASFVEKGRKHHRIEQALDGQVPTCGAMNALRECFEPRQNDWPGTDREWEVYALKRFEGDEVVQGMLKVTARA